MPLCRSRETLPQSVIRLAIFRLDTLDDGARPHRAFHKIQYSPPAATIFVRYENGLFLPVPMSSVEEAALAERAEEIFLALLGRFTAQGQNVSPGTGPNHAPTLFARHPYAAGLKFQDFRGAMQRLVDRGKIRIETLGHRQGSGSGWRASIEMGALREIILKELASSNTSAERQLPRTLP